MDAVDTASGISKEKIGTSEVLWVTLWAFGESKKLTKGTLFWVFFSALLTQAQSIASISLYGYLMTSITEVTLSPGHSLSELIGPFITYASFALIVELLKHAAADFVAKAKTHAEIMLKTSYIEKLMTSREVDIETVFTTDEQPQAFVEVTKIYEQFMTAVTILVSFVTAIAVAIYLGTFNYILPLALVPLALIHFFVDRKSREVNSKNAKSLENTLVKVKDTASVFTQKAWRPILKNYGAAGKIQNAYTNLFTEYTQKLNSLKRFWASITKMTSITSEILGILILSIVLYFSPDLMAIGSIYVQLRLVNLLKSKLEISSVSISTLKELTPTVLKYVKIFQLPTVVDTRPALPTSADIAVTFDAVEYRTPMQTTFKELSFSIQPCLSAFYIRKENAASIVHLITGSRVPNAGKVLIQNSAPHLISSDSLNKHIGVIAAERLLNFLTFREQFDVGGEYALNEEVFESYAAQVGFVVHKEKEGFFEMTPKRWKEKKLFRAIEMVQFLLVRELYQQKVMLVVNLTSFSLTRDEEMAILHLLQYIQKSTGKKIVVMTAYLSPVMYADMLYYFIGTTLAESGNPQTLLTNPDGKFAKHYVMVQLDIQQREQAALAAAQTNAQASVQPA